MGIMMQRQFSIGILLYIGTLCVSSDRSQQAAYRLSSEATYLIVAPRKIRPNMAYQIQVTVKHITGDAIRVRASMSVDGQEYARASQLFTMPNTLPLEMLVPETTPQGKHKLFVEGVTHKGVGQVLFRNETLLDFNTKWVSVFIQPDRPVYKQDQQVTFRVLAVYPDTLKPASGTITIYIKDAKDNTVLRFLEHPLNLGIYEGEFMLSYPFNPGTWTITVVGFGHRYTEIFRAELFWHLHYEVNVTMPHHIMNTEWGVAGQLYGEHRSSKLATGNAKIKLTTYNAAGDLLQGEIFHEIGHMNKIVPFAFSMEEMEAVWGPMSGMTILVEVFVTDWFYQETKYANAFCKIIQDGVRVKLLGRKYRSFKPGIPFTVYFAVERTDGSPYTGDQFRTVSVQIKHEGQGVSTTPEQKFIIPDDNIIRVQVLPKERDERIVVRAWQQLLSGPQDNMIAYRYFSPSNHYVAITSSTESPKVDEYIVFTVRTSVYVEKIHYVILAGPNILYGDELRMSSTQKTFAVAASRAMAPRARILVYFMHDAEVVSDVMNLHIMDTRMTKATLETNLGKDFSMDTLELIGRSDPGAFMYLAGNDHEWWRRGASTHITLEDIIHELASYDEPNQPPYQHIWWYDDDRWEGSVFFPSHTSGMDTVTTFEMAGLYIFSDMNMTFMDINPVTCNTSLGLGRCPNGQCYQLQKKCDGFMDCTDGYDEVACPDENPPERRKDLIDSLYRMIRYYNDARWAWKKGYIMPYGSAHVTLEVPKSTDPWVISGFFLHPEYGFSIVENVIQHDCTRPFYLIVNYPPSARRGEQIGLECSVYNNLNERMEIILMLHGGEGHRFVTVETNGVVSSYAPRTKAGDIQTMVELNPGESKYVYMPILPTVESGEIEMVVSAYSSYRRDSETIAMEISWDGITNDDHTPFLIDLINQGSVIIPDFYIPIPEQFIHPEEPFHRYVPGSQWAAVSLFGDIVSPGFFEDHLTTDSVVGIPFDNAEGYMFDFAINLQTLRYLQATQQLSREAEENALAFMKSALMRTYAFLQDDGSIKMFRSANTPSLWETAFSCKSLHSAQSSEWSEEIYIPEEEIIGKMANWMVDQQQEDGSFFETSDYVYDRKMLPITIDEEGNHHNWSIPLTAYVTIALSSLTRSKGTSKTRADEAKNLAAEYISKKLRSITDPYQMAISAFALQVSDHRDKDDAFNKLQRMKRVSDGWYWAESEIDVNEVQVIQTVQTMMSRADFTNLAPAISATAYALKLYLSKNRFQDSVHIMKWLNTQRNGLMGYSSTQDTLLALEALAEFALFETNRFIYNMEVHIEATYSPEWSETFYLNTSNFATLFEAEIPVAHGQIRAWAQGTGYAVLQMDAEHNVEKDFQLANADYETFEINYEYKTSGRNASHVDMTVCTRWIRPDIAEMAGMCAVYVDVPTGFRVSRGEIDRVVARNIPGMRNVEFHDPTLWIYWDYMTQEWQCVQFRIIRFYPVANVSIQHGIGIFEYLETGMFYDTLYTTHTLNHLHICQACGSFQCPYCPFYNHAASSITVTTILITIITTIITLFYGQFYCVL